MRYPGGDEEKTVVYGESQGQRKGHTFEFWNHQHKVQSLGEEISQKKESVIKEEKSAQDDTLYTSSLRCVPRANKDEQADVDTKASGSTEEHRASIVG